MRCFGTFRALLLLVAGLLLPLLVQAQGGTVPTFAREVHGARYTLLGQDPASGGTLHIPVTLVPVSLRFGTGAVLDAGVDVPAVLRSPLFAPFSFPLGGHTQYGDALLRSTVAQPGQWHTLLAAPNVHPLTLSLPAADGYLLHSRRDGGMLGVVDADYLQRQIFAQLGGPVTGLVIAFTHNTTFYADGDATICCTTGTHGIDPATGTSFVLGSYFHATPAIVQEADVQPLAEQLGEFAEDPLHNPQHYGYNVTAPGNAVPAWLRPLTGPQSPTTGGKPCGGTGLASSYFLLAPTDTNRKNNLPAARPFVARAADGSASHLAELALLSWYTGNDPGLGAAPSFPDPHVLAAQALPCPAHRADGTGKAAAVAPAPRTGNLGRHQLIGYWTGSGPGGAPLPLRAVSPQWDTVIVAFAAPEHGAPEGTLRFRLPPGIDPDSFRADVQFLQSHGKTVLLSLGGGGAFFQLDQAASVPGFVSGVASIVSNYGFNGVDIDFESPSLVLDGGDTDFRHPKTPSVVHLITGLRQLRERFGPQFVISLVPEGPQVLAGALTYGGQFGSYLPLIAGLGDALRFVDVQDYNTPPIEGLDGEIYQTGSPDYQAAATELLLQGFPVGGSAGVYFPPQPAGRVAVGFLVNYTAPEVVDRAMRELITGRAPAGSHYRLRQPGGYPDLLGAMFWTIDDDLRDRLQYSNLVGPELHGSGRRAH